MGTSSSYVSYVKDLFVLGLAARSAGRGVHTLGEARSELVFAGGMREEGRVRHGGGGRQIVLLVHMWPL